MQETHKGCTHRSSRNPKQCTYANKKLRCAIKALQARRSLLWAGIPSLKDAKKVVRSA